MIAQSAWAVGPFHIVVLPTQNLVGDTNLDHWQGTISMMVKEGLRSVKPIRLIPESSTKFAFKELELNASHLVNAHEARRIGAVVGATDVAWGGFRREGTNWWLGLRVLDVASGKASLEITFSAGDWSQVIPVVVESLLTELRCPPTAAERKRLDRPFTQSAEALEILSRTQHQLGSLAAGEEALRRAVRLDPRCVFALQGLAVFLTAENKLEEALKVAKEAIRVDPDNGLAHRSLGVVYLNKQLDEPAARELTKAAELLPDDSKIQITLAELYVEEGKLGDASRVLRQAESVAPYDPMVHVRLANVYERLAEPSKAAAELQMADRYQSEPEPWVDLEIAKCYASSGDVPEAIRFCERHITAISNLAKSNPDLVEDQKKSAEILARLKASLTPHFIAIPPHEPSESSDSQGIWPGSVAAAQSVVDPFASTAQMQSWARQMAGKEEDALSRAKHLFTGIADIRVGGPVAGGRTASAAFRALSEHQASLTCEEYALLYVALARCVGLDARFVLVDRDPFDRTVTHACAGVVFTNHQALLVDPNYRWFGAPHKQYRFLTDQQATAIYLSETGELSKQHLAAKLFPDSARVRFALAYSLGRCGRLAEAECELQAGLKVDPASWRACLAQGAFDLESGWYMKSEMYLRQALALNGDCAEAHYLLGEALDGEGKAKDAVEEFRASLLGDIPPQWIAQAKKRIADIRRDSQPPSRP